MATKRKKRNTKSKNKHQVHSFIHKYVIGGIILIGILYVASVLIYAGVAEHSGSYVEALKDSSTWIFKLK